MKKEHSTILILSLALIALYLVYNKLIFLYVSLGMVIACLVSFQLTQKIHWLWMGLSGLLGTVSSFIILSIIFFVVVTPLALVAKLTGKRFLILKRNKNSYFKQRNFLYDKESIENIW